MMRDGSQEFEAISIQNTTLGVVATNAKLTKAQAKKVAQMAQDGFARAIVPSHTSGDGDTIFALATGTRDGEVSVDRIGALAADAMVGSDPESRPRGQGHPRLPRRLRSPVTAAAL